MRLNLETIIKSLDGRPYTMPDDNKPMTLGRCIVRSLLASGDQVDGQVKAKRFELALDLHGKASADMSADDIAMARQVTGMLWITEIVGQVNRLLDGKEQARWDVKPARNGHVAPKPEPVPETPEEMQI